jgi:hypothetical protein
LYAVVAFFLRSIVAGYAAMTLGWGLSVAVFCYALLVVKLVILVRIKFNFLVWIDGVFVLYKVIWQILSSLFIFNLLHNYI